MSNQPSPWERQSRFTSAQSGDWVKLLECAAEKLVCRARSITRT